MKFKVDSPYCWIQAISAFLFHAVFFGVSFSFGIFYVALLQEFPGREGEAGKVYTFNFVDVVFVFWQCFVYITVNLCVYGYANSGKIPNFM